MIVVIFVKKIPRCTCKCCRYVQGAADEYEIPLDECGHVVMVCYFGYGEGQ